MARRLADVVDVHAAGGLIGRGGFGYVVPTVLTTNGEAAYLGNAEREASGALDGISDHNAVAVKVCKRTDDPKAIAREGIPIHFHHRTLMPVYEVLDRQPEPHKFAVLMPLLVGPPPSEPIQKLVDALRGTEREHALGGRAELYRWVYEDGFKTLNKPPSGWVPIATQIGDADKSGPAGIALADALESRVRLIAYQILLALHHLHSKGMMHRDLKTDNVLVEDKLTTLWPPSPALLSAGAGGAGGAGAAAAQQAALLAGLRIPRLRIIDFGKLRDADTTAVAGTAHDRLSGPFTAPEVYSPHQGTPADIFSAGVTICAVVTSCSPFLTKAEQDAEMSPVDYIKDGGRAPYWQPNGFATRLEKKHVRDGGRGPASLEDLLDHMLVHDPAARYSAAQCLAHPWFDPIRELVRDATVDPAEPITPAGVNDLVLAAIPTVAVDPSTPSRPLAFPYDGGAMVRLREARSALPPGTFLSADEAAAILGLPPAPAAGAAAGGDGDVAMGGAAGGAGL